MLYEESSSSKNEGSGLVLLLWRAEEWACEQVRDLFRVNIRKNLFKTSTSGKWSWPSHKGVSCERVFWLGIDEQLLQCCQEGLQAHGFQDASHVYHSFSMLYFVGFHVSINSGVTATKYEKEAHEDWKRKKHFKKRCVILIQCLSFLRRKIIFS